MPKVNLFTKTKLLIIKNVIIILTLFLLVIASTCPQNTTKGTTDYTSLNGLALVVDPSTKAFGTSKDIGYLADGEAYSFQVGDVFSFAPVQLPHGAVIKNIKCVVLDNSATGYIQINLIRGPINTSDPVVGASQIIASAGTFPANVNPAFQLLSAKADTTKAKVDNTKYGYFFRVDFLDNTEPTIKKLSLRGCIIEYLRP